MYKKKTGPQKPLGADEILAKMEHYCAYQERCRKEVLQKLASFNPNPEDALQILQVLEGDGFFNDERFARAYAGGKFRVNHWGKVRIRLELRKKMIAAPWIEAALNEISETDYNAVIEQLVRKKKAQYAEDQRMREKIIQSLLQAGFEFDRINLYL